MTTKAIRIHQSKLSGEAHKPRKLRLIVLAGAVASLLLLAYMTNANAAADIVALKTRQPFHLDGIPSETFWAQIPATQISLEGTTPYGGNVPHMWIKAAHNGSHVFLLLQWPDAKESRKSDPAVRLILSTPGNLTGRYFYNETYYYTDAAAVTWWMGTDRPRVKPATNNEFGPAPTRRASLFGWGREDKAELWVWKAKYLDLGNPSWPYSNIDPGVSKWVWGPKAGEPYTMPYSSAFQNLFNYTGTWTLGDGLLHAKACQQPGTKPFEVRARGVWSSGMWTLELARPFVPSPENRPYTITFEEGRTYWITLAAFDGNRGEWEEVASISKWLSIEISKDLIPQEKQVQEALAGADQALKAAAEAAKVAGDALKTAQDALSTAQQATAEAVKVAGDALKTAQDALSTAQQAIKAIEAAQSALSEAQKAVVEARSIAEATATTSYAAIGLAVIAILVSVVMRLRRPKP